MERAGLGKTLMERIAENKPEVVTLLKIQVQIQEIQETLLTLKEQLEKQERNDTKVVEKVAYIPPWAKAVIAAFFIAFVFFIYKNVR